MKRNPIRSLQGRLIFSHLLGVAISLCVLILVAGYMRIIEAQSEAIVDLEVLARTARDAVARPTIRALSGDGSLDEINRAVEGLLEDPPEVSYAVYAPDGMMLASGGMGEAPPFEIAPEGSGEEISRTIRRAPEGGRTAYVALPVGQQGAQRAWLTFTQPLPGAFQTGAAPLYILGITGILMTLGVGAALWPLTERLSRRLEDFADTIDRLANGDLNVRMQSADPEELALLADSINRMARRFQSTLKELRTFVPNASHELRTPLTSVKLRAEALLNGALEDPDIARRFIGEIEREVDRLSSMVNDILDLSRIEAGLVTQRRVPLDLGLLATEVGDTFRVRAENSQIQLQLTIEPDLPIVRVDENQIRRVISNMVDNALKFTPTGGSVGIDVKSDPQASRMRLCVTDTGVGIPPKDLPHIFERFYRVRATRPRYQSTTGSGLGLSIAKSLIEAHGGDIGVTSKVGAGSTFWFEIPAPQTVDKTG